MTEPNPEWNPDLYIFEFPDVPQYEGLLVEMPLIHKVEKIRVYVTEVLKQSARCLGIDAEIPALITGLAIIDYLAGFYAGRQSKKEDYIEFMHQYFPSTYRPFLEYIYHNLRCGMLHNLVAMNPWKDANISFLIASNHSNHLMPESDKTIFSVKTFLEDIRRSWWKFAHTLIMKGDLNPELVTKFHRRFNKLQGIGAFMVNTPES